MKRINSRRLLSLSLFLYVLALCCGCSGPPGSLDDGGGIGGTGIMSSGPITAFGSIFVNGTEFDTHNAAILVKGQQLGVGDAAAVKYLDVGRVVTVEGRVGDAEVSHAVADRVRYRNHVKGPVESVGETGTETWEIVVLGQTVAVNGLTVFKGTSPDTLKPNDVVAVSGLIDYTQAIQATFVEKTGEFTPGLEVEVRGTVQNMDSGRKSFEINNLTVDYSSADTSKLPGGAPYDGLIVDVGGTLAAVGGPMSASKVEAVNGLGGQDVNEIQLTGFVTEFISASDFTVGYQAVQTGAGTRFVDGTPDDLKLGVQLEVEGRLVDNVLFARQVEFWGPDQIEVEGLVTDFVSVFEFTVGDQVVHTDAETVYVEGTPADIALNGGLKVKGRLVGNILLADRVSFEVNQP